MESEDFLNICFIFYKVQLATKETQACRKGESTSNYRERREVNGFLDSG